MPGLRTRIRDGIGRLFGSNGISSFGTSTHSPAASSSSAGANAVTPGVSTHSPAASSSSTGAIAAIPVQQNPELPLTTTSMTREQLKARRMARVEQATHLIESLHVKVMLKFLDGLCLLGPFWILVFTTSEVGQLFTGKPFDLTDQTSVNVYAAALFGECILAGLTFMWQYVDAYKRTLELRSEERQQLEGWVRGLGCTWAVFALISAVGQFVYLRQVWHPSAGDTWGYALIVGRVTLYTAGEWACAKYLGWRMTTLKKLAQEERVRGELYHEIAQQEAARIEMEAEAEATMRKIEQRVREQERTEKITGEVQEIMGQSAVKFLGQFTATVDAVMNQVLANVNERLALPPVEGEVKAVEEEEE